MPKQEYVYGRTEAVAYTEKGVRVVVHIDQPWLATDPVVKELRHLFADEPFDPRGTVAPIERATAEPGERRSTRRPKVDAPDVTED